MTSKSSSVHRIHERNYYLASYVKEKYPSLFKGVKNSMQKFIAKYKLNNGKEYIYARHNGEEYIKQKSQVSNKLDKLFLRHKWVRDNTEELRANKSKDGAKSNTTRKELLHSIYLEDDERLCDAEGNYIDVDVRGERHPEKIYFKVKDISVGFGMESLYRSLINKRGYIRGEDYVCVSYDKDDNYTIVDMPKDDQGADLTKENSNKTELNEENDSTANRSSMMTEDEYNQNSKITKKSKKKTELNEENDSTANRSSMMTEDEYNQNSKITKESSENINIGNDNRNKSLYLTYVGLMRVLFRSRNECASRFTYWATKIVCTVHMGTKSQKQSLAGKLIGVTKETIKDVFSRCAMQMSCIYLIYLGTAKDLRDTLNINEEYDDKQKVYKFGRTDDLSRRMNEHSKKYKDIGCKVELVRFSPIDPSYTTDAESNIKSFFSELGFKLDNKKYVEITIFGDDNKKVVNEQYKLISDRYMGKYKDIKNNMDLIISQAECKVANVEKECQTKLLEANKLLLESNQKLVDAKQALVDSRQEVLDIERKATKDQKDQAEEYDKKIRRLKAKLKKQSRAK